MRPLALALVLSAATAHADSFALDGRQSDLTVRVYKKGVFSAFAHDHFLHPQRWRGTLFFNPERPAETRAEVIIDAASLVDRQPKLSERDRAKVEAQIRSPAVLDAQRFAEIRFTLEGLALGPPGDERRGTLTGTLQLHGVSRRVTIATVASTSQAGVRARGRVELRQSDFGIHPARMAGGAIAVQDRVTVELDVRFVATSERRARRSE
jgi:polyisoprenoid-binding protein YceI